MYLKNVIASLFEKIPFLDIALIRVSLLKSFNFTDNKCDVPKQMSPFVFNPFLLLKMWIFFFLLKGSANYSKTSIKWLESNNCFYCRLDSAEKRLLIDIFRIIVPIY